MISTNGRVNISSTGLLIAGDLEPQMVPALSIGGETLYGYLWDKRKPLGVRLRVDRQWVRVNWEPIMDTLPDGSQQMTGSFRVTDITVWEDATAEMLVELIPGLLLSQAHNLDEQERIHVLATLHHDSYYRGGDAPQPEAEEDSPLAQAIPSIGAEPPLDSPPSTRRRSKNN